MNALTAVRSAIVLPFLLFSALGTLLFIYASIIDSKQKIILPSSRKR